MKSTETSIQIRFVDIDQLGHVNNAIYLSYLEVSRLTYFQDMVGEIDWVKQGIILGRIEIDYKIPILLKDKIKIKTWCSRIGTKSFDLSYTLLKMEDGKEIEVAVAKTIMVCFDYTRQLSIAVPERWKENML